MTTALVLLIIVLASVLFAVLVNAFRTTRLRIADRRRARIRGVPFAGSVEITAALPSLVAPELGRSVRDFHVSRWIQGLHQGSVGASGVLTVDRSDGTGRLGWEPDPKSARRGAHGWQLDLRDITYVRINALVWDFAADVTVHLVDSAAIRLVSDNTGPLRRVLTDAGIAVVNGSPRKSPSPVPAAVRSTQPTRPTRPRRPWFVRTRDLEQQLAEARARQASLVKQCDDALREQLRTVPSLVGRTRTWDDVADYLRVSPAYARQLLKDAPPAELERLGLAGQPPPA